MKQAFIFIIALLLAVMVQAQPKAVGVQNINGCKVYSDAKNPNVFYYDPFGYRLATDRNGKPALSLLQMRRTGTVATGNSGNIKRNNILQFKIEVDQSTNEQLQAVKRFLQKTVPNAVLKPLPVARFESLLVYAPANNADSSLKLLTGGHTENGSEASPLNASYWTERNFSIRLSDADAQLIATALENKSTAVSMSYAFYTGFSFEGLSSFNATVSGELSARVMEHFDSAHIKNDDTTIQTVLVKADAVPINADTERWPEVIRKIDINEKLPPSYPLLDVYCYDFNNAVRTDLYSKKIEIRATSVNGTEIFTSLSFKENQPDVYAKSIRFAYAVRFDRPFYFRVTDYTKDGEMKAGEWKEKREWTEMLDITSTTNDQ